MDPSNHHTTPGGWTWPEDTRSSSEANMADSQSGRRPGGNRERTEADSNMPPSSGTQPGQQRRTRTRTHWPPRTCRICLGTVEPTFHVNENLPNLFRSGPNVTYESEEGRLIRPCRCKGSQRYVHEGCLQAWRHSDASYGRRTYWNCPTCGYQYRLDRMSWGRIISSTAAQLALTILTLFIVVFLLGFVGDYILDLYFDPWSTITGYRPDFTLAEDEKSTWADHFLKGGASLGLLSFFKYFFSPTRLFFRWGGGGGRPARGGRERLADVSMIMVVLGVATFLYSVWQGTRALSRRYLNRVAERVLDVQGDDDDDDDDN